MGATSSGAFQIVGVLVGVAAGLGAIFALFRIFRNRNGGSKK